MKDKSQYTIVEKARNLYLEYDNLFAYATDATIRKCYNGVGNEALPDEVRAILTNLTAFFGDLPFMIHDFEYTFMKKTKYNFHKSNKHLKNNLLIILNDKLPKHKCNKIKWWQFWKIHHKRNRMLRYYYLNVIKIIYFFVEEFGWSAFNK